MYRVISGFLSYLLYSVYTVFSAFSPSQQSLTVLLLIPSVFLARYKFITYLHAYILKTSKEVALFMDLKMAVNCCMCFVCY